MLLTLVEAEAAAVEQEPKSFRLSRRTVSSWNVVAMLQKAGLALVREVSTALTVATAGLKLHALSTAQEFHLHDSSAKSADAVVYSAAMAVAAATALIKHTAAALFRRR